MVTKSEINTASYATKVANWLKLMMKTEDVVSPIGNPDNAHNTGRLIGSAFFWDMVYKYAEKERKKAWEAIDNAGLIEEQFLKTGNHTDVVSSPHFRVAMNVSEPIQRFDPDTLAELLLEKRKVPLHVTKELIELSKKATASRVVKRVEEI